MPAQAEMRTRVDAPSATSQGQSGDLWHWPAVNESPVGSQLAAHCSPGAATLFSRMEILTVLNLHDAPQLQQSVSADRLTVMTQSSQESLHNVTMDNHTARPVASGQTHTSFRTNYIFTLVPIPLKHKPHYHK
jgi:hypothetical protein